MTTIRAYRCNLCHDALIEGESGRFGWGVHFSANAFGSLVFKRLSECEHHICHGCAKAIHDELRKVTPAPIKGATNA